MAGWNLLRVNRCGNISKHARPASHSYATFAPQSTVAAPLTFRATRTLRRDCAPSLHGNTCACWLRPPRNKHGLHDHARRTQPGDGEAACCGSIGARHRAGVVCAAASPKGDGIQKRKAFSHQPGRVSHLSGCSCEQGAECTPTTARDLFARNDLRCSRPMPGSAGNLFSRAFGLVRFGTHSCRSAEGSE